MSSEQPQARLHLYPHAPEEKEKVSPGEKEKKDALWRLGLLTTSRPNICPRLATKE